MTLEDAILVLAESIQQLAAAMGAYSSPTRELEPAIVVGPTYGPPTFDEWMEDWKDVGISSINKGRKPHACSICGLIGVNARTHPHQD